jgi:hypothetical protein
MPSGRVRYIATVLKRPRCPGCKWGDPERSAEGRGGCDAGMAGLTLDSAADVLAGISMIGRVAK